jgi:hypothetical protein
MIATPLVTDAIGFAAVIAGAALIHDRLSVGLRRSVLTGAVIGLWLVLWLAAASFAMANADLLTELFGSPRAPERTTFAAATLSWLCAAVIARGLIAAIGRGHRHPVVPGILVSLAWLCMLILPWLLPGGEQGTRGGPALLILTIVLATLIVPVSRI